MRKIAHAAAFLVVSAITAAVFAGSVNAQLMVPGGGPDMAVDARTRAETIHLLAKGLREAYVFPDTANIVAAMLEDHLKRGDYDQVTSAREFAQLLTTEMEQVAHDKHLRVMYSSQVSPHLQDPGQPPDSQAFLRMREQARRQNFGFESVALLPGNVGYLRLNLFAPAEGGAGAVAAGAMAFLTHTDALIIDLRENHGGGPEIIQFLITYLYPMEHSPVHLNDIGSRREGTDDYSLSQSWTLPYVPGERYGDKKEVYVLTSHGTFSAAEEFAYDLQTLKRAMVVGEVTGGGANPGGPYRLGNHFLAFMPRGRAINPITKTNWEGKGVQPDIQCAAGDALTIAQRSALRHLIAGTQDQQVLNELKAALAGVEPAEPEPASSSAPPAGTSGAAQNVTGGWTGEITDPGGNAYPLTFNLKSDGKTVTGSIVGGPPSGVEQTISTGRLEGDRIYFEVGARAPDGSAIALRYEGKVSGTRIQGSMTSPMGTIPFTVSRR